MTGWIDQWLDKLVYKEMERKNVGRCINTWMMGGCWVGGQRDWREEGGEGRWNAKKQRV